MGVRCYNEGAYDAALEYYLTKAAEFGNSHAHYHAPFVFGIIILYRRRWTRSTSDEHHSCVAIRRGVLMRSNFVSLDRRLIVCCEH